MTKCIIPQWLIAWWCLGNLVLKSAQPMYSLRKYIFIYYEFVKCILFYESELMHEWSVLNWFKMFECVLRLGFKLCKLIENMSCWNFLCFMKKLWFLIISKCLMKCWICLVLREHDLVTTWFYSMIQ
jgi:hypothetical protein